ncbi:MAG TPA: hypothetical protein VG273_06755, partial [Bryobacteraceae bacterium]|nr:hypothetical protein [Bryobacteraceae bacterium]
GAANVKLKDYEPSGEVESENEYAAWAILRNSEAPLQVGDLLETSGGELRICKYVGFEEARWFVPAPPPVAEGSITGPPAIQAGIVSSMESTPAQI